MPLTGTERRSPLLCCVLAPSPSLANNPSTGRRPRRILCSLQAQAHAVPFDGGIVESDIVRDGRSTRKGILGSRTRRGMLIHLRLLVSKMLTLALSEAVALWTEVHVQDTCPCKNQDADAFRSISRDRLQAGVACIWPMASKRGAICFLSGIDSLK